MAFTITVNNDDNHSLTFSKNTLARRNEANVSVTVVVPAAVFALGSFAYIDFVLPDGSTYFKGDYDPSSGSFTFTLGSADTILSQDGRIGIQFVLRDSDVNPTVVWKSELKYSLIGASADATAQALTGIPAPATFPITFPAANVSIVDAGTYFASPDVEDALQEVGLTNNTQDTNISNIVTAGAANPFTNMPYVGVSPLVESGSNANGCYIKFADGTMICYDNVQATYFDATNLACTITFPANFISTSYSLSTMVRSKSTLVDWAGLVANRTTGTTVSGTTTEIYAVSGTFSPGDTAGIDYIAVGRWKA